MASKLQIEESLKSSIIRQIKYNNYPVNLHYVLSNLNDSWSYIRYNENSKTKLPNDDHFTVDKKLEIYPYSGIDYLRLHLTSTIDGVKTRHYYYCYVDEDEIKLFKQYHKGRDYMNHVNDEDWLDISESHTEEILFWANVFFKIVK